MFWTPPPTTMIDSDFKHVLHLLLTEDSKELIQHWLELFDPSEQDLQHRYYADFLSFFEECVTDQLEFNSDSSHALFNFMVKLSECIGEEKFYNFRNSVFTCHLKFPLFQLMEKRGVFTFKNVAILTAFFESITSRVLLEYLRKKRQLEEATIRELQEREAPLSVVGRGILMVSIMGTMDSQRVLAIIDQVLEQLETEEIKHVIIDIGALSDMNHDVANQLIKLNRAIRLMGSRAYLTGITRNVAKSLIHLDIQLGDIQTYGSTKDALEWIME